MNEAVPSWQRRGHSIAAMRDLARAALPRPVFDFADGGAEDEVTLRRNEAVFADIELLPRPLDGTNGRDLSARGRFWIEPATGHVLASELVAEDFSIKGTIDVDYESESAVGLLVPSEMRERYDIRRDGSRVDGAAVYSRFRQFQVTVDEKLTPIVKQ